MSLLCSASSRTSLARGASRVLLRFGSLASVPSPLSKEYVFAHCVGMGIKPALRSEAAQMPGARTSAPSESCCKAPFAEMRDIS